MLCFIILNIYIFMFLYFYICIFLYIKILKFLCFLHFPLTFKEYNNFNKYKLTIDYKSANKNLMKLDTKTK